VIDVRQKSESIEQSAKYKDPKAKTKNEAYCDGNDVSAVY